MEEGGNTEEGVEGRRKAQREEEGEKRIAQFALKEEASSME